MTNKHKTPEELAEEYNLRREQEVMHEGPGLSPFVYEKIERIAGFFAGYEAARPKWISVKERLPDVLESVLVVYKPTNEQKNDHRMECWNWPENIENVYEIRFITHWMPLPEPPKDL